MSIQDTIDTISKISDDLDKVAWYRQNRAAIFNEFADLYEEDRKRYNIALEDFINLFRGNKGSIKRQIQEGVKSVLENRLTERIKDHFDIPPEFRRGPNGQIDSTQHNLVEVLSKSRHLPLCFDEFTNTIYYEIYGNKMLPWPNDVDGGWRDVRFHVEHQEKNVKLIRYYRVYDKYQLSSLKLYLQTFFIGEKNWTALNDALIVAAMKNRINIHQDHFRNGLPEWDHIDRMDILHRYAGVENRIWASIVMHSLLLGMMARCFDPGYDYRGVVVLEGPENSGKTRFCRLLAFHPDFYTFLYLDRNTEGYEISRRMLGMTIVELQEMGNLRSRTNDYVKVLLSSTFDINRKMYQDEVEHVKRRGVFVITTNETGNYLPTQDSNTRFMPVYLPADKINIDGIISELPMLLAQAMELWDYGIEPRLTDVEENLQKEMLRPREVISDYYHYLLHLLANNSDRMTAKEDDGLTMEEIILCFQDEYWWGKKPVHYHKQEIRKALPKYFYIQTISKHITGKGQSRKWRYAGKRPWPEFIASLQEKE